MATKGTTTKVATETKKTKKATNQEIKESTKTEKVEELENKENVVNKQSKKTTTKKTTTATKKKTASKKTPPKKVEAVEPKKEEKKPKTLQEQAEEILQIAEEAGVQSNFLFITTFKRYQVQLQVLSNLEKEIKSAGVLVTKTYVKGRENVYTNPAVDQYNKTSSAANNTVTTLINIIQKVRPEDAKVSDKGNDLYSQMSALLK